jgi:four helix bundle protein
MSSSGRKLFVYEKSLVAARACEGVARSIPSFRLDLIDQLRRASTSIPLNIAEGAGEFSPREKVRFYRIARRSASECEAILDVLDIVLADPPQTDEARAALSEVLALLTNTAKAVEDRQK